MTDDERMVTCEDCELAGQSTTAVTQVDVTCEECGRTRVRTLCVQCVEETRQAPPEALWCEDCRRDAAMSSR